MFFFQRKYEWRSRVVSVRDEWGEVHKIEIPRGTETSMTDRELQEELQTTAIIRRIE